MNIFYLDKDPKVAAQMACDKHVSKMIVESCQMLSTAHRILDGTDYYDKTKNGRKIKRWKHPNSNLEPVLYKASHVNHPSTKWVMDSGFNYVWLYNHMLELNEEFKKRYGHTQDHKSVRLLGSILSHTPININWKKQGYDATPAMPDYCKVPGDSVASYRKYYINEKKRFATWKAPAVPPSWYTQGVKNGKRI
jgi:hypothetical protein